MIRFLQSKDNRLVKAIFIVIIGAAVITMVVTLIPGIFQDAAVTSDTYATVYAHWYSRFIFTGEKVSLTRVQEVAQQQMQRQRLPEQYAQLFMPRLVEQAGQQLILQKVLLAKAASLGIQANDDDVRAFLHTGQYGELLFPNGNFIGEDKYRQFIQSQFDMSTADFEKALADDITINRLRAFLTDGVTVNDNEIRDQYRKQNVKIKFDYAVISSDDLRKQINPSDADLQAFFVKNAARYSSAVPEERRISYFAFTLDQLPGGVPKATPQEIQAYYSAHQTEYQQPEQARSRHILIKFPGGAAKSDAEAKAKAEALLKQIQGGGNFADLAKKNSEDTGSGLQGGELGFARRGTMVPEFDTAIFNNKIGDVTLIHSQFGYHIVQVEERQAAHTQALAEVEPTIQVQILRQKESQAESAYAQQLASDAAKSGLEKTAAAHHLQVVTTPPVNAQGTIAGLPDGSQVIAKAFTLKQGAAPAFAPTGEGYAILQVAGIAPPHAPTFADWKDKVAKDYADERLPQLLSQKTKELADKAHAENDLAKAAKEVGATVKTSDLVGDSGQVPDFGQVGTVAPELFTLNVGAISGPINAQRTGVVAKLLDKQEPTADEITKNLDQTREQALEQRRDEAFGIFVGAAQDQFKKAKLIQINAKAAKPTGPVDTGGLGGQ
jgi:peptidyl-prolyl cis-trans isomerase D